MDLDALWKRADITEDYYRGAREGTRDRDCYEMAKIVKELIAELRAARPPLAADGVYCACNKLETALRTARCMACGGLIPPRRCN